MPHHDLKLVQKKLNKQLLERFIPHDIAHAYTKRRGIITNATQHIGATSILHIDLVDFFGSIKQQMVKHSLRRVFTDLEEGCIEGMAAICCYRGFVPQGAPTSPMVSNVVCYNLDEGLQALARSFGCSVTRYSDDISFSTEAACFPRGIAEISLQGPFRKIKLGEALNALIASHGFEVNSKKLRYQTHPDRLQVTGLVVGERVSVANRYRRIVRAMLHRWERYGLADTASANRADASTLAFTRSLKGSIDYIGQVAGRENSDYRRLLNSFEALLARDQVQMRT